MLLSKSIANQNFKQLQSVYKIRLKVSVSKFLHN